MVTALIGQLLRDPKTIARSCREDRDVRAIAVASLVAILVGGVVFGGVVGSLRGGVQIAYAAVKVPLAVVATLAIAAPAFHGIAAGLGRPWPLRAVIALALAAAGRASLLLLAFAPALWLTFDFGAGYHAAALLSTAAYGVSGVAALGVLVRGLGPGSARVTTAAAFVAVFFAAFGQTSWTLRPFLVRPRSVEVPFVRGIEGGFADALFTSTRSSFGSYDTNVYEPAAVPVPVPVPAPVPAPVPDLPTKDSDR